MKKLLLTLVITILVLLLGIAMAPARLASSTLEKAFPRARSERTAHPEIRLVNARGTLWDGSGQLLVNRRPVGNLSWQVQTARLLGLEAAVDWQLNDEQFSARGTASAHREGFDLRNVQGSFSARFLDRILSAYDISPSGTLNIEQLDITDLVLNDRMDWPGSVTCSGRLSWTGGPVRYRLSGQTFDIELPQLLGIVTTSDRSANPGWPELEVTDADTGNLLLTGRLTPKGTAAIGITRGLTRLTGQPWPGSEPDHVVVLEVEEQLN